MCFYPKYRFPVPEENVLHEFKARYGWSNKSHAFIWDKRDKIASEVLCTKYRKFLDLLEEIPCGQCLSCRASATKELAQRAMCEATLHEDNYFITLTYDNEHLEYTKRNSISRIDGSLGLHPALIRRDFQLFAKMLRKYYFEHYNKVIKIFYCGEYGPQHGRPHFHAIIYGCPLPDLKFYKRQDGYVYYTSEIISNAWRDYEHSQLKDKSDALPRGYAVVTDVNWETCSYVAGYIAKKSIGKSEKDYLKVCSDLGVEPLEREFHQGGKRPGLGLDYFQANKDKIYEFDSVVLPDGNAARPCHYFDSKYDLEEPEFMEELKERRVRNRELAQFQEYKNAGLHTPEQIEQYEAQKIIAFTSRYKTKNTRNRI